MNEILKTDTENTTRPASEITASKSKDITTFSDVMDTLNDYFTSQSRDQSRTYKDGNVHLIREDFDIISFVNTVHQMVESYIKTECELDNDKAKHVSEIFKALKSLTTLLRGSIDVQEVEYLFI